MPTYTIVAAGTEPLGPGEIAAGGPAIQVSDGDVFVIDPSADSDIIFQADGGIPADFDVVAQSTNNNSFNIDIQGNLTSTLDFAANSDLSGVDIDATSSDGLTMTAADGVSLGQFDGSNTGVNDVTIGNGFTTTGNWSFGAADDRLIVGDDATFANITTGAGNDTVEFGDRATTSNIHTEGGNDSVRTGDDFNGGNIHTGGGDDTVYTGANAQTGNVDGGSGNDSHTTETTGMGATNFETTTVVCYAPGTMIDTPDGSRAVETLRPGDVVLTMDHGPQPVRWIRSSDHPLEDVEAGDKPVLIAAGALGKDRPAQDLIVSPQHRILVGACDQLTRYFDDKAFAPAKALTRLPGIRHMKGKTQITWIHFACDRHEAVTANGCLSESLLLGPMVVNGLTHAERRTLTGIFGPVTTPGAALNGSAAHVCLKVGEAGRQIANGATAQPAATAKEIRKWDVDAAMERYDSDRLRYVVLGKQARRATAA